MSAVTRILATRLVAVAAGLVACAPLQAQVSTTAPLEPIGSPPPSMVKGAPAKGPAPAAAGAAAATAATAAAAKDAGAQAAQALGSNLPKEVMPTFNVPSKAAPAPTAPAGGGSGSVLKLPDANAPMSAPPIGGAARPVAAPSSAPPPPGAAVGMPMAAPAPRGVQGTVTTTSSGSSAGGVVMLPNTGGVVTVPAGGVGDSGLPPTPNYPPTPLMGDLPGLGRAPGTQPPGKPLVVRSVPGVNDIVPISRNFPNRIATPFNDPVWVDQGTANIDKLHSSVFITPKNDRPIQIFVTENNDPTAAVVQLTLLPRTIPGQTIVVEIEGYDPVAAAKRLAKDPKREAQMPDEYTDRLLFLLREVARGRAPDGYTEESLSVPVANLPGGVQVLPDKRFSGSTYDIFKYRIRNAGTQQITLQEQSFYQKGVRAVSFFPLLQLAVGQETAVHIITSKDGE